MIVLGTLGDDWIATIDDTFMLQLILCQTLLNLVMPFMARLLTKGLAPSSLILFFHH